MNKVSPEKIIIIENYGENFDAKYFSFFFGVESLQGWNEQFKKQIIIRVPEITFRMDIATSSIEDVAKGLSKLFQRNDFKYVFFKNMFKD